MAWTLSISVVLPAIISSDVCLTMPVDRNEVGARRVELAVGRSEIDRGLAGPGQIDCAVLRRNPAADLDHGRGFVRPPGDVQHFGAVMGIARQHRLAVGGPLAVARFDPIFLIDRRQRDPGLADAGRLCNLEPRHDLETAPSARRRIEVHVGAGELRPFRGKRQRHAGFEKFASVHGHPPKKLSVAGIFD